MIESGECRRRFLTRLVFGGAIASFLSRRIYAHAKLIRSIPKNKARLTKAPVEIEFWFDERLEDEFNTVEVFDSNAAASHRKNLAAGKPKVDPADRTHLVLKLELLKAGDYTVEYRVLSRDSHTAPGRIKFSILGR
jgi:methionine-rich copper-binding protein CopC